MWAILANIFGALFCCYCIVFFYVLVGSLFNWKFAYKLLPVVEVGEVVWSWIFGISMAALVVTISITSVLGMFGIEITIPFQSSSERTTVSEQHNSNGFSGYHPSPQPTPKPTANMAWQPNWKYVPPSATTAPNTDTWGTDQTTADITGPLSKTSYWTSGGKSYHFNRNCPSLSRSKNVHSGTLQDALDAGKKDPCDNCAK